MATPVAAEPTADPDVASQIESARGAAIEVFGNCAGVELMHDPECPEESWHVFSVEDSGDFKAVIDRQCRWYERVGEMIPDALNRYRVSVIYRS